VSESLALGGVNEYFYGITFGKYDFVIEFFSSSMAVASGLVQKLTTKIGKHLKRKKVELCISLVFGVDVLSRNSNCTDSIYDKVRAYVFFQPKEGDLSKIVQTVDRISEDTRVHAQFDWTNSIYKLLVISSPCYEGVVEVLETFRSAMQGIYKTTSTCVALDFKEELDDGYDTPSDLHKHRQKFAIVYIRRQKSGKLILPKTGVLKYFRDKSESKSTDAMICRLGGYDNVLILKRKRLGNIIKTVDRLRTRNVERISHTATILLYEW
jgi:hypothetical protein